MFGRYLFRNIRNISKHLHNISQYFQNISVLLGYCRIIRSKYFEKIFGKDICMLFESMKAFYDPFEIFFSVTSALFSSF